MVTYTEILSDDEYFKFSSILIEDGSYDMPSLIIQNKENKTVNDYIDNPSWLWKLYTGLRDGDLNSEQVLELETSFKTCNLDPTEYGNYFLIILGMLSKAVELKMLTKEQ